MLLKMEGKRTFSNGSRRGKEVVENCSDIFWGDTIEHTMHPIVRERVARTMSLECGKSLLITRLGNSGLGNGRKTLWKRSRQNPASSSVFFRICMQTRPWMSDPVVFLPSSWFLGHVTVGRSRGRLGGELPARNRSSSGPSWPQEDCSIVS